MKILAFHLCLNLVALFSVVLPVSADVTDSGTVVPIISLLLKGGESPVGIVAFAQSDTYYGGPGTGSFPPSFSYNISGGAVTGSQNGVGMFQMTFSDLSLGRGNVQVSSTSSDRRCVVRGWGGDSVSVACYDSAGAPANAFYFVSVVQDKQSVPNVVESSAFITGFVWANSSASPSYTPDSFYSYNSSGGGINIRRGSTGSYIVDFEDIVNSENIDIISAYGGNASCTHSSGNQVFCTDSSGAQVDSRFSLMLATAVGTREGNARIAGYAWANNSTSARYTPNGQYSYNSRGNG